MTRMTSLLNGLMGVLDVWATGIMAATAADIEAKAGKDARRLS